MSPPRLANKETISSALSTVGSGRVPPIWSKSTAASILRTGRQVPEPSSSLSAGIRLAPRLRWKTVPASVSLPQRTRGHFFSTRAARGHLPVRGASTDLDTEVQRRPHARLGTAVCRSTRSTRCRDGSRAIPRPSMCAPWAQPANALGKGMLKAGSRPHFMSSRGA